MNEIVVLLLFTVHRIRGVFARFSAQKPEFNGENPHRVSDLEWDFRKLQYTSSTGRVLQQCYYCYCGYCLQLFLVAFLKNK